MVNDASLPANMDTLVMERNVQGWQGAFRTNPAFHLVLAFFVGIVAGLGAVAFRRLIGLMHNAFFFDQISSSVWSAGRISRASRCLSQRRPESSAKDWPC
jgi:CIC family chloride channel protein